MEKTYKAFKFSGELITAGDNAKTVKGDKASEFVTAIMYLAPADLAGGKTVCPFAVKAGCKEGCLYSAGRGVFNNVQQARIRKTQLFLNRKNEFMNALVRDIQKFVEKCERDGRKPAVRLNGTSDIQFEDIPIASTGHANIFDMFPQVQFYDYTKIYKRAYKDLPDNYHLTLSYSQANAEYGRKVMQAFSSTSVNVAIVYRTRAMVEKAIQEQAFCIDGDETDLRLLDGKRKVVCLYAKGRARKDASGFVVDYNMERDAA